MKIASSSVGDYLGQIAASASSIGSNQIEGAYVSISAPFSVPLITPQTLYYTATVSAGTMTAIITITSYTF